jgi:uncharacterized protein (DUF58 family)
MTRRRTAAALASDHGPPERAQHAVPDAIVQEVADATVSGQVIARRVRIRPPIECITLSKDEHEAAAMLAAAYRLRDDYDLGVHRVREEAGDGPRIRSNLPPITLPDAVLDALARYRAAMTLMGRCGYVVTRVVCDEIGLADLERMLGRNRQELAGVLKAGLGTLVDAMEGRRRG